MVSLCGVPQPRSSFKKKSESRPWKILGKSGKQAVKHKERALNAQNTGAILPQQQNQAFEILAPAQWLVPMVFNSPHSGKLIPESLKRLTRMPLQQLHRSEDCFVDELFSFCLDLGAPMLRALFSRTYLDLNREPYELDPQMFVEPLPGFMNSTSPRVLAGLGTLPRIVSEGEDIYRGRIPLEEALARIDTCYRPYHRALTSLINELHEAMGFSLLIDCHSMPSSSVKHLRGPGERSIDVVLGDRFGAACNRDITGVLEHALAAEGLNVVRNRPYAGGFITETHGSPRHNRHAVQIEINRALYMDELKMEKIRGYSSLQNALMRVFRTLADFLPGIETSPVHKAAE
jgi:N-formylglutamate amidohydrolase